jgi:hypothetical protein
MRGNMAITAEKLGIKPGITPDERSLLRQLFDNIFVEKLADSANCDDKAENESGKR